MLALVPRKETGLTTRSYWLGEKSLRDPTLSRYFGYGPTVSGESVTEWTALNYSAVWAAVRVIVEAVAALPLFLYQRLPGGGRDRLTTHRLHRILHDQFNPEMTSIVARETLQAHLLTWGNAYAEIQRNGAGDPIALFPITPDRVQPDRGRDGQIVYRVHNNTGPDSLLRAENVLHVPGLGFDGLCGYSVVHKARETIGLGLVAQKYGAQFFGNGAVSSITATHPGKLGETALKNLKSSIADAIGGDKRHSVLVLEEGLKVEKISIPPDDAQFLQSRAFQVIEMCRWFNLSPYKLRDLQHSAVRANIEQESIEFVTGTLRPWLVRWEQEINRKLLREDERSTLYVEHLVDGLLRGDIQSRYQAYAVGRQWGWLSADDVRERENMNPLEDGSGRIYLVPMNMAPADRINDVIDAQTAATPPPAAGRDLQAWREATIRDIAGKFARREIRIAEDLEQDRKIAHGNRLPVDAARETDRLGIFYKKFVDDAMFALRPWLQRFRPDVPLDDAVRARLVGWASATQAEYKAAVSSRALGDLVRGWQKTREDLLTRALLEAIEATK